MSLLNLLNARRDDARRTDRARRAARLSLEALETRQVLSTFTVSNLADAGTGSLRQAIAQADGAGDAAVINVTAPAGTISLQSALPELSNTHGITINGEAGVKVDLTHAQPADGSSVEVDSLATATVSNLEFDNAPGRAFENKGTLTLDGVTVQGAHNGGAVNYGVMNVNGSTFQKNSAGRYGGAINNFSGSLAVSGSTFTGNSAGGLGGAIENAASLSVTGSTFTGNKAADGGAIHDDGNTMASITSSTIAGNTAGMGGGLFFDGTAGKLVNDDVYGNAATAGMGGADISGAVNATSSGNLIGTGDGLWGIVDNNPADRAHVAGRAYNPQVSYNSSLPTNYIGTDANRISPVMEQVVSFEGTTLDYKYTVRSNSATLTITPGSTPLSLDSDKSNDNLSDNNPHYDPDGMAVDLYLADSGNGEGPSISLWQGYDVDSLATPSLTITEAGGQVSDGLAGLARTWNGQSRS